jgi:glutaminyl-tRNA synthetase
MSGEGSDAAGAGKTGNFIRNQVHADLQAGIYATRHWSGTPAVAGVHRQSGLDAAHIRTRFPPEPNGYLHIGHAKSICLNFGLARDFGGRCHLRFDDTNPAKEDQEYVDAIIDVVHWLGFRWDQGGEHNLYFASDYFEQFYRFAQYLIEAGFAYVDSQSADEMRGNRGNLTEAGIDSPHRQRSAADSLKLFEEMRAGLHAEGSHVLRARIDMSSPNINLRDPALYRIRLAEHHRTGRAWNIYPMYDYAHPISDALENITHSICTLEFEDHRPFYDWLLERLADGGFFERPLPHQYEFSRLNISYCITSKRKLQELVQLELVDGWDDPRMPTLVGLRRRGYTPQSLQLFCERIGVSKADSWIDMSVLEQALRDDLERRAPRAAAVLDPLELVIVNLDDALSIECNAAVHPQQPELGLRSFLFTRQLWIEREDFIESPSKGYFRLFPGNRVRLRHGFVVECIGCDKNAAGEVIRVTARYLEDSKSGTPGSDQYKVKGNIHWLSQRDARSAQVRLYDRLFSQANPDAGGADYKSAINPNSKRVVSAWVEPGVAAALPGQTLQFERHGYFIADQKDHQPASGMVFNRAVSLKDSWAPKR